MRAIILGFILVFALPSLALPTVETSSAQVSSQESELSSWRWHMAAGGHLQSQESVNQQAFDWYPGTLFALSLARGVWRATLSAQFWSFTSDSGGLSIETKNKDYLLWLRREFNTTEKFKPFFELGAGQRQSEVISVLDLPASTEKLSLKGNENLTAAALGVEWWATPRFASELAVYTFGARLLFRVTLR